MKALTSLVCLGMFALSAHAADIGVVGLFPGKAVLVVGTSAPKIYAVGSNVVDGAKLVAADNVSATIEVNGKRQVLAIGEHVHRSSPSGNTSITLHAGANGHFMVQGQINGGSSVEMLVDTGASFISIPAADAKRLGINYKNGRIGRSSTANGIITVYLVRLDSVKIGDVELNQVDASVNEGGLPVTLLGMSFLNRMEMRRDGEQMTLTKRF
ncbi:MAG: TIGR02281 family clan AA aspartic protease [Undibacterium sp.]|nr:TIGR02281 family clan AA aspartic protease [Undibacterium sp.]MDO8701720.1 TIGR02281 family clan AA aspartic protease [Undibacterium sp.]